MHRIKILTLMITLGVLAVATLGWHEREHTRITRLTAHVLPNDMPAFFAAGVPRLAAHLCIDPDVFKHDAAPQLSAVERPEHYLDLEYLAGRDLPEHRYEFAALCRELGWDVPRVGALPYAITEWTQRLMLAFAEHRRWPDDPDIQAKCLTYAGLLAHYAEDLCQPLHTTVHFDGRVAKPGDPPPHSGIHFKMDRLFRKLHTPDAEVVADLQSEPFDDLFAAVVAELKRSHALVDQVYALESALPEGDAENINDPKVEAFALDRLRTSVVFTASLFHTAWVKSADVQLHDWADRAVLRYPK